jgi:hypothetical protein
LFLQLFECAYDLDKQQTLQNTYGSNKGMIIPSAIGAPDTRLVRREVTRKYAVKITVKHAQSGTMIKVEVIIHATHLSYELSP